MIFPKLSSLGQYKYQYFSTIFEAQLKNKKKSDFERVVSMGAKEECENKDQVGTKGKCRSETVLNVHEIATLARSPGLHERLLV